MPGKYLSKKLLILNHMSTSDPLLGPAPCASTA